MFGLIVIVFLVLNLHACVDVIMFVHFCMLSNINGPAQTIIMLLRRWFREISPQVMDSRALLASPTRLPPAAPLHRHHLLHGHFASKNKQPS